MINAMDPSSLDERGKAMLGAALVQESPLKAAGHISDLVGHIRESRPWLALELTKLYPRIRANTRPAYRFWASDVASMLTWERVGRKALPILLDLIEESGGTLELYSAHMPITWIVRASTDIRHPALPSLLKDVGIAYDEGFSRRQMAWDVAVHRGLRGVPVAARQALGTILDHAPSDPIEIDCDPPLRTGRWLEIQQAVSERRPR